MSRNGAYPKYVSTAEHAGNRSNGGKRQVKQVKRHAIIPIFIPHKGCPNDCIFCNQKKITARQAAVKGEDVKSIIETWLSTLEPRGVETIEVAFFGGSFTGIPMEEQSAYLKIAKAYKDAGRIHKIHMSTRPDYINKEILDNLKTYSVDTIELGVQSLDDHVLTRAGRGHNAKVVYESSRLIKDYGFELGIQLMIGLPGDTLETCIYSALETVKIGPAIARLYPTIVINDTELYNLYKRGEYKPLTQDEAIRRTKEMYKILDDAGINIIRVGLKSTDLINDSEDSEINGGTYHPAFRQLVEGEIARERIEEKLNAANFDRSKKVKVDFFANAKCMSNLIGHKGKNKQYFLETYPYLDVLYKVNDLLLNNQYRIEIKE
ncbi:MAG: radical SAM protein [Firmicutes bacterium]|nr:radical SAM protein [Bacillota bacterium]